MFSRNDIYLLQCLFIKSLASQEKKKNRYQIPVMCRKYALDFSVSFSQISVFPGLLMCKSKTAPQNPMVEQGPTNRIVDPPQVWVMTSFP